MRVMSAGLGRALAAAAIVWIGAATDAAAVVDLRVVDCTWVDQCAAGGGGGNTMAEPGEAIRVRVDLTNIGDETATNVAVVASTMAGGVMFSQNMANAPDIAPGGRVTTMPDIVFELDRTVPCGTPIQVRFDITSNEGTGRGGCDFNVPVPCTVCTSATVALSVASCASVDACGTGGPGDANGSIDPGETGSMRLRLRNDGPGPADNVSAQVTSPTPGVMVIQPGATFGTIACCGGMASGGPEIVFTVDESVACGTVIQFDVSITSVQQDTTDTCSISIPVACTPCAPAQLRIASCLQVDSCPLGGPGDGDSNVDPGETVSWRIVLQNDTGMMQDGLQASVMTSTPGVMITQSMATFPPVPAGGMTTANQLVTYDVADSLPCGTVIVLDVVIFRAGGPAFMDSCTITIPGACNPCDRVPALAINACTTVADSCAAGGPGDNNLQVDPGEIASIELELWNMGLGDANNVNVTVTTPTPGVMVTSGAASFGTIAAGATAVGTPAIEISVLPSVPCGTGIVLNVMITSTEGNFSDNCTVTIPLACDPCAGANPVYSVDSCTVVADTCAFGGPGHLDGNVDPGETVTISITAANTGAGDGTGVTGVVTTTAPGVTVTQPDTTFGDMPSMTTAVGSTVEITVGTGVACGTNILLTVTFSSPEGGGTGTCTLAIPGACNPCAMPAPQVNIDSCRFVPGTDVCDTGGAGDGDDAFDPGETATIELTVANASGFDLTGVTAGVTVPSPAGSSIVGPATINFGAIADTMTATGSVSVRLPSGVACGTGVVLELAFGSDQGTPDPNPIQCADVLVADPCTPCVSQIPEEVPFILPRCDGSTLILDWDAAVLADWYNIYVGTLGVFVDPMPPDYDHACGWSDIVGLTTEGLPTPPGWPTCGDGMDLYFLVVGENPAGEGPYGYSDIDADGIPDIPRPAGSPLCP